MVKSKSEDSLNFENNNYSHASAAISPNPFNITKSVATIGATMDESVGNTITTGDEITDDSTSIGESGGTPSETTSLQSTNSSIDNPTTNSVTTTPSRSQTCLNNTTLKIIDPNAPPNSILNNNELTESQEVFRSQLNSAFKKLFSFLDIDYEHSMNHR